MKLLRFAIVLAVASCATALVQAEDKHPSKPAKCCAAAEAKGEKCSHECCVAAAKEGDHCTKCNGSGKIEPKK